MAAMAAFFAVIAAIAILVNAVNYLNVTKNADETLSAIIKYENEKPDMSELSDPPERPDLPDGQQPHDKPFLGLKNEEANYMTRFFVVKLNQDGEVVYTSMDYIASVKKDEATQFAKDIMSGGRERGYMGDYRFCKNTMDDGFLIAFLNTSRERGDMKSLMLMTIVISVVSLIVVFILVTIFSKRAIRPYANNIKMQKKFITDASHELKTPLTSISTSLDVIELEHEKDEWTDNIRKQTKRMSKLVNELVVLSRLDEDMPLPEKESFSLSDAAWEIVDVHMPGAYAAKKKLDVDIADDVKIVGDKASVQQMLSVLLDNSIRYSDDGGEIRLTVYKKGNRAYVEVFNTCDYATPPDVDRLFDRFYRPDESRNEKTGGTGVGLSIAKAVMVAHGGRIEASCPSGKTMTIKASFC